VFTDKVNSVKPAAPKDSEGAQQSRALNELARIFDFDDENTEELYRDEGQQRPPRPSLPTFDDSDDDGPPVASGAGDSSWEKVVMQLRKFDVHGADFYYWYPVPAAPSLSDDDEDVDVDRKVEDEESDDEGDDEYDASIDLPPVGRKRSVRKVSGGVATAESE
jgi:hypothetical protein